MAKSRTLLLLPFVLAVQVVMAQQPRDMWEVGVHGGSFFVTGDVDPKFGYGYGVHIRKAADYIFSMRLDLMGGQAKGENKPQNVDRVFTTDFYSGTVFGVVTLNNFRNTQSVKKVNLYAMVGAGINTYQASYINETFCDPDSNRMCEPRKVKMEISPQAILGAGLSFRLSPRINIGLEHQVGTLFGKRADLIDGSEKESGVRTPFRDLTQYTSIRFNFNIGNTANRSEPLYWKNPFEVVLNDMQDVKKRTEEALKDSDGDGVIDAVDQEPDTPSNAPVDTRGRTLDSDKDGVADFRDKEPFYPPRSGERVNADGVVVNPISSGGVTEERVKELISEALQSYTGGNGSGGSGSVTEWFLPMIHFGSESASIKYSDYGTLASLGRMLKGNANLKLVITGHTDQTGNEEFNDYLSYMRAKAVVDHLVANQGIARGRLIIQWKGKNDALVPSTSSYMNRRVEFRVAGPEDVEMDPPKNTGKKTGGY